MKKLLSIVVASVLLLTTSAVPTLAKGNIKPNQLSQNTLAEKHLDAPSEYFKTFCNDFFKDCSTYEALDLQGHNITKQFYNDNLNASMYLLVTYHNPLQTNTSDHITEVLPVQEMLNSRGRFIE